jgi:hypothetical protein
MNEFSEEELDLCIAALWFAHLNRQRFYEYVNAQGHQRTCEFMENSDMNQLRQKLTNVISAII